MLYLKMKGMIKGKKSRKSGWRLPHVVADLTKVHVNMRMSVLSAEEANILCKGYSDEIFPKSLLSHFGLF